jgi:hypothetical protein
MTMNFEGRFEASNVPPPYVRRKAVLYARVSSVEQEREGFSIPAQQRLLRECAENHDLHIVEESIDVETAKQVRTRELRKDVRVPGGNAQRQDHPGRED